MGVLTTGACRTVDQATPLVVCNRKLYRAIAGLVGQRPLCDSVGDQPLKPGASTMRRRTPSARFSRPSTSRRQTPGR